MYSYCITIYKERIHISCIRHISYLCDPDSVWYHAQACDNNRFMEISPHETLVADENLYIFTL